jgi:hypothetical protein
MTETLHHVLRAMMQFPFFFFGWYSITKAKKKKKKKKKKKHSPFLNQIKGENFIKLNE